MGLNELAKRVGATRAWHEFSKGWGCHRFCFAFGNTMIWLKAPENATKSTAFEYAEREALAYAKSAKLPAMRQ